jgi:glycosyltransferase involved in cell wall biosynthesis
LLRRKQYDFIWIEKEALPWLPAWIEKGLLSGARYSLDYDDAVFHNYDLHSHAIVRGLLGRRIDRLMGSACLVTAGNEYLAQRARAAGARRVEIIPTVIDLDRYAPRKVGTDATRPTVVWIGSPSTVRYLSLIAKPLAELSARLPFRLRVIGGHIDLPGVDVEYVAWSEDREAPAIAACDVGVMPLNDSPWERGKCGYKLIQYMACGLPVVASPVGVNAQIVNEGVNGFLADGSSEWRDHLEVLISDATTRRDMGQAGRLMVEEKYSVQAIAPRLAVLLNQAKNSY